MTKKEFENHDKPLVMIISLDPSNGKVLYDTYDWESADSWKEKFGNDFPNMLHLSVLNKAAIRERKKAFGLNEQ